MSAAHAIQVLVAAGLTKGKRVTGYEHVRLEAEQAGATYVTDEAVCDGRLVTRRLGNHIRSSTARYSSVLRAIPRPPDPEISYCPDSAIANKCLAPFTSSMSPASAGVARIGSPIGFFESSSYWGPAFTTYTSPSSLVM